MARIRTIKPQFFTSEDVTAQPPLARLLFVGLFTECDRDGRVEDRPKTLKMRLLPADDVDVDALLWSLVDGGLIRRYEANGKQVIHVCEFSKHQKPHPKEADSILPADGTDRPKPHLNTASREKVINLPVEYPSCPQSSLREGVSGTEYGDQEGKGREPTTTSSSRTLIAKRNLHAEYEHPRFDVPISWHLRHVKDLGDGEAGIMRFYVWLAARVDRTNEDTIVPGADHPRFEWLDRCFKEWGASTRTAPSPSDALVEATKRRQAEMEAKHDPRYDGLTLKDKFALARKLQADAS